MSRLLVTGASGFIGRRTLGLLSSRGFEVHAVARRPLPQSADVRWHAADVLDPGQRRSLVERVRAKHLLHLAWYGIPGSLWTATENASWVAATIGLAQEFAHAGGERMVLAGTCAEYDWSGPQPLHEDASSAPGMFYGVCKESAGRIVAGLGANLGFEVARGRVFFLYGPQEDERRLVSGVARGLVCGERVATSTGEQVRDFLHVDDVAGAFAAIAGWGVTGIVNIGAGQGVTVRRVIDLVAAEAGRPDLLDVGALPLRPGEPPEIVASTRRLNEEVGYVPQIALEEGLAATVAWWREHVG